MAEQQTRISKVNSKFKPGWISILKNELKKSPIASNVCFGFILPFLEEDIGTEFECPCDILLNALFAAAYFIVPAVVAFLLMMSIQGFHSKTGSKESGKTVAFSILPAILWIVLLLLDGQIFACAMTSWPGSYVELEGTEKKWCKPANSSREFDYETKTRKWFTLSQAIGMGLIILFTCGFGVYIYCICSRNEVKRDPEASEPENNKDMDGSGDITLEDI